MDSVKDLDLARCTYCNRPCRDLVEVRRDGDDPASVSQMGFVYS